MNTSAIVDPAGFLTDLRRLIESARKRVATVAYSTQTLLRRHLGDRPLKENLRGGRAGYGKRILVTVSRELMAEYGRGFSHPEITRMIQFAQLFPEKSIVVTLSQQLSWSHFQALLPIKDPLARDFYSEMCRGFSAQNLWRMPQFFVAYRDFPKLSTLLRVLPWSSHLHILSRT